MGHVARRVNAGGYVSYQGVARGPDGREHTKTFQRKLDAQRWVTTQDVTRAQGDWIDPTAGRQPFGPYAADWLHTKQASVAPSTYANLEVRLRKYLLPAFGDHHLARIRTPEIRTWTAELTRSGLAPETVRKLVHLLAQILGTAEVDRLIARSPVQGIQLPRAGHRDEMTFLTPTQITVLADAIDPRYRTLIYTAAYTGLRAGELGALRFERLDLLHGTLQVVASLGEVHGSIHEGPTKTGRHRTVAIPRFLAAMVTDHLTEYPSRDGHVFSAPEGGPLRHRAFMTRFYRPAVKKAELPSRLRFHDLRHTCAALLIASGAHLEEIKDHLGHASIRTTSDRYGHLYQDTRDRLRDHLDQTFSESLATSSSTA
jgi:integrase